MDSSYYQSYMFAYLLVGLVVAAFLGLIPANIAASKGRSFGAWWFYGWMLFLIALIHALSLPYDQRTLDKQAEESGELRRCPQCAEYVKREARVCKHCGFDLTPILDAEARAAAQSRLDKEAEDWQRHEAERQERERRREVWERKAPRLRKAAMTWTVAVVAVVLVAALLPTVVVPNINYYAATSLMDKGRFQEAGAAFTALGNFRDSEARVTQALAAEMLAELQGTWSGDRPVRVTLVIKGKTARRQLQYSKSGSKATHDYVINSLDPSTGSIIVQDVSTSNGERESWSAKALGTSKAQIFQENPTSVELRKK